MDKLLRDSVAVVTGAASGNGRAIAKQLAAEGADVVVADIQREPRQADGVPTDEHVESETAARATFVECDVSNRADIERSIEAAEPFGGIDIMINNAGVFRSEDPLEVTEEEYDRLMDINLKGTFFGAQVAGKRLVENGGGSIVNISSTAGLEGSGAHATYCASKGGVRLLTYALADALGPDGVRVNAVHPGLVDTAMTTEDVPIIGTEAGDEYRGLIPSRRFGEPDDVAGAVLYLVSEIGGYVNGESLVVDGGATNTT